jgi:hypothetical protein
VYFHYISYRKKNLTLFAGWKKCKKRSMRSRNSSPKLGETLLLYVTATTQVINAA